MEGNGIFRPISGELSAEVYRIEEWYTVSRYHAASVWYDLARYYFRKSIWEYSTESGKIDSMEHIDLRKLNGGELKQVRRQVVRLKKMRKTGKEIEELTGVRQNRGSEIWTAYQREGDRSMEPKKRGFQKGTHLLLTPKDIRRQCVGLYAALGIDLPASDQACPKTGSFPYLKVAR